MTYKRLLTHALFLKDSTTFHGATFKRGYLCDQITFYDYLSQDSVAAVMLITNITLAPIFGHGQIKVYIGE